ncbi:MAG: pitrilysin family protein [Bdellovibrionota bacterium]
MKRFLGFIFSLALLGCANHPAQPAASRSGIPERPDALGTAEINFKLPTVERFVLDNGLVVIYKYDDELPHVSGTLYIPGGRMYDPPDISGLAVATGFAMRDGGVPGYPPEKLDRTLDNLAAAIASDYGVEIGSVGFSCLAEDFEQVFGLMSKVVREPSFDEKRLELWKKLTLDGIRRRRDNPQAMSTMAFAELIYGKNTPFAHFATEDSIRKITRSQLQAFAKRFIRPNGSILAISGAIPLDRLKAALNANFGSWARVETVLPELPKIDNRPAPGIYVLERDFDQSTVLMGHLGPPRLTPDVYEMSIYNRVLGSAGFGSRLFDEIRTQLGLAYDVEGGLAPAVVAGTFQIYLGTRSDEVIRATKKTLEITKDTLANLPAPNLFADAKSAVERSFIFRFDSSAAVVARAAEQELFGFPPDYDANYLSRISGVSPERVQKVGQRWVKPDDLVIVIIGKTPAEKIAEGFASDNLPVYRLSFDTAPHIVGPVK